jgi:hypothetical protein
LRESGATGLPAARALPNSTETAARQQPAEKAGCQGMQGRHRARSIRETQGSCEVAKRPTLENGQEGRFSASC